MCVCVSAHTFFSFCQFCNSFSLYISLCYLPRLLFHLCSFIYSLPDVKLLENQEYVENVYHQVSGALLEYTLCVYPQHVDRFSQLLLNLRELRVLSTQAEDYLSYKHLDGEVPCNKLLIEMLHAKRACVWHRDTKFYTCTNTNIYVCIVMHKKEKKCMCGVALRQNKYCTGMSLFTLS